MSSQVELELQRVRSLLAPERVNKTLEETDPNPSPESIGAEAGIGFTVTELHFTFSVYVFNDWDGSNDAADELEARHDDDDSVYALAGTNGVLTFYGVVPQDVDNALELRFALADMVSAFSGDE